MTLTFGCTVMIVVDGGHDFGWHKVQEGLPWLLHYLPCGYPSRCLYGRMVYRILEQWRFVLVVELEVEEAVMVLVLEVEIA